MKINTNKITSLYKRVNRTLKCTTDITNYTLYNWSHDFVDDFCNRRLNLFNQKIGDFEGVGRPFKAENKLDTSISDVNEQIVDMTVFKLHCIDYNLPMPISGKHIIKHNTNIVYDISSIDGQTITIPSNLIFDKNTYLFEILSQNPNDFKDYIPKGEVLYFRNYNVNTGELLVDGVLPNYMFDSMTGLFDDNNDLLFDTKLVLNLIQLYEPLQYLSESNKNGNIVLECKLLKGI